LILLVIGVVIEKFRVRMRLLILGVIEFVIIVVLVLVLAVIAIAVFQLYGTKTPVSRAHAC
jgi:hypothetical protein